MRSDVITITNKGEGFEKAMEETRKAAVYEGLTDKETRRLQMLTEEILSTAMIISGDMKASFWIECEGKKAELHMATKTLLDKNSRAQLINASSSKRNEAAHSFLGSIRDAFEQAMASESEDELIPYDVLVDISGRDIEDREWYGYECSILRRFADDVKVSIKGAEVEMVVSKDFSK